MNGNKKPVRGVMPKSQLARKEDVIEATSGSVITPSAQVAHRLVLSSRAVRAGETISTQDARKAVVDAATARARGKKQTRSPG